MPASRRHSRSRSRSRSPARNRRRDYSDDERERPAESSRRRQYDNDERDGRPRNRSRSRERSYRRRDPRSPSPSRSQSPPPQNRTTGRSNKPLPSQNDALASAGVPSGSKYGKPGRRSASPSAEAIAASKPNFANSGALAAETNTFKGVVLKYNEPPEARKPNRGWRLYVFKGKEQVDMVQLNRQSAYLFGRDKVVSDVPLEHPSSSKQHAVIQFRSVFERNEFGESKQVTKPYLIDLESANGTTVNGDKVPPSRFYELKPSDVIKFAYSTREYVLIVDT